MRKTCLRLSGNVIEKNGRGFKYLSHFLPVGFRVEGGLSKQGGVLLRGHTQLIVEGVVPDLTEENNS